MSQQIPMSVSGVADLNAEQQENGLHEVAPDLAYKRLAIVNVVFVGAPHTPSGEWVLIDAGLPATANLITSAAATRYGANSRPAAIIMTHGHADHAGGLETLAKHWDVPVVAHELEIPYLNGTAAYPPPDTSVGGGMMSFLSPIFPRGPFDVSHWLQALPEDGTVPFMPGWRWVFTPGHTPGHISLWREEDRTIIAGDAFITTRQESAYAVLTQTPEMHGPPMYYTQNWVEARNSVERLSELHPELAITGHGPAMRGGEMRAALDLLARDFSRIAVPRDGEYVEHPRTAQSGSAYERI